MKKAKRKSKMHFYTMTIIEETDSEYKAQLTLYENVDGKIWLQVGHVDSEDPFMTQGIPLTKNDAEALVRELNRLLKAMDTQPKGQGKQLTLTPEPVQSKVNWNK